MLQDITIKKRSVRVSGHDTSITLEQPFWDILQKIAHKKGQSINQIISEIDKSRSGNLSSAIRLYVLKYLESLLPEQVFQDPL